MSTVTERSKDPEGIASEVGLPDLVGRTARVYLDRLEQEDYQIPADARTYPAIVYYAARDEGKAWTAGEVAEAAGVSETAVSREFRRLVDALGHTPEHADPEAFLQRFGQELSASSETVNVAVDLYREGADAGLFSNRTPAVVASLCLYAASTLTEDDLTQADFEEFGVSRTSIRKGYNSVLSLRGEEQSSGKISDEDAADSLREAVEEIHAELLFPAVVLDSALERVEEIAGQEWTRGKSAAPIASAIYWLAADENRMDLSQGDAADAAPGNVHKVTVNRRVAAIRENTDSSE